MDGRRASVTYASDGKLVVFDFGEHEPADPGRDRPAHSVLHPNYRMSIR